MIECRDLTKKYGDLYALDRLTLKIPIIGPIMHKAAIARFSRTLSTMFAAGVPLVEAMESVAGATGSTGRSQLLATPWLG